MNYSTPPNLRDEEALSYLMSWLRDARATETRGGPRSRFTIQKVIQQYLGEKALKAGDIHASRDNFKNSEPFYCALSILVIRGIVAPIEDPTVTTKNLFCITDYGNRLLEGHEACLPLEYSRFAQILVNHGSKFGAGYKSRSGEAIRCYESQVYMACCTMCGAAAESILLAIAIEKKGSEDEVLKEYRSSNGRSKVEQMIIGQHKDHIRQEFTAFMNLLKYWRDESAHGAPSDIQEGEAFTSLLMLLRFAQFADTQWAELTKK